MSHHSKRSQSSVLAIMLFFLSAVLVLLLDLWSKAWMFSFLSNDGESRALIKDFLYLTRAWNEGVAFGMFQRFGDILLLALPLILLGLLVYAWQLRKESLFSLLCLGAIFGGALGNYYDRLSFGAVRDFIDVKFGSFYDYPIFNLADAAISVSVFLLIVESLFFMKKSCCSDHHSKSHCETKPAEQSGCCCEQEENEAASLDNNSADHSGCCRNKKEDDEVSSDSYSADHSGCCRNKKEDDEVSSDSHFAKDSGCCRNKKQEKNAEDLLKNDEFKQNS